MQSQNDLEVTVLAVFRQALAAGRHDVAEHLLSALEALDRGNPPGPALGEAYLSIAAAHTEDGLERGRSAR